MPKKRKRNAGLHLRKKHFTSAKCHIKKCEDIDQIMLKEGNVEENKIQNSPLEEKIIEKKNSTYKKR